MRKSGWTVGATCACFPTIYQLVESHFGRRWRTQYFGEFAACIIHGGQFCDGSKPHPSLPAHDTGWSLDVHPVTSVPSFGFAFRTDFSQLMPDHKFPFRLPTGSRRHSTVEDFQKQDFIEADKAAQPYDWQF